MQATTDGVGGGRLERAREMLRSTLIFAVLLIPAAAHAQYSNHSMGLAPQVTTFAGSGSVMWGLSLEFSNYLEGGFGVFARVPALIAEVPVGADTPTGQGRVFATGGSAGVRYLFVEGFLQPWIGLQLTGLVLMTQPVSWFLGTGATVGLDWVLTESISVGARGIYDVFIQLNGPWRHQLGGSLAVSVLF
jgi:outer membrane protein